MRIYICFLLTTLLLACTESKEPISDSENSKSSESLHGNWQTQCTYSSKSSLYEIRSAAFSGTTFVSSSTAFVDSNCSMKLIKSEITGAFVLGSQPAIISQSRNIDWTLSTVSHTVYESSIISNYNTSAYCEYSDWIVGVTKNITGKICGSSNVIQAGDMNYDIFVIWPDSIPSLGITQGALNFGHNDSTHDGTIPSQRPTSVDGNFDYFRQ